MIRTIQTPSRNRAIEVYDNQTFNWMNVSETSLSDAITFDINDVVVKLNLDEIKFLNRQLTTFIEEGSFQER